MAPTLIQINFKLYMSGKEYELAIAALAQAIADVAGLQWKIWVINEATHESGGICLFEDEDAANAFLNGPLLAHLKNAPSIAELQMTQFAVLGGLTAITRGPAIGKLPIPGNTGAA